MNNIKFILLALIITLVLGVCGCMKNNSADKIVQYMNDKYDDKFEYCEPFGGGASSKPIAKEILLSSEKYPGKKIWASYNSQTKEYRDNYTEHRYEEQFEQYLTDLLSSALDSKVIALRDIASRGCYVVFDADTTFEQYIETPEQKITFSAAVKGEVPENKEAFESKIKSAFEKNGAKFLGNIYFINDDSVMTNFSNMSGAQMIKHPYVYVNESSDNVFKCEWR